MNPRRHVQHLLSDYIDGCLSPTVAHGVEAHLAGCPTCTQELEQWRMMLRLVSTHASIPCPIDCATAVLWQIEAQRRAAPRRGPMLTARRPLRPTPFLPILAVTLALLGGATWLWSVPATRQSTATALRRIAGHSPSPLTRPRPLPSTHDLLAVNRQGPNSTGLPLPTSGSQPVPAGAVRAYAPDRLEGAFGRSDSLILAADFAEDDR